MDFHISLTTFQQIETFIALASRQPFDVQVGNDWQNINGKDLMGMFSLDYCQPLRVQVMCSEEEFTSFRAQVAELAAK